ncbi:MAG: winged helix-turn-helix domain-containing protein [Woeseiaceae bacterium]|nr:winged helix-turn-helix domain-containing protein [Woeseiaceae bacterium]
MTLASILLVDSDAELRQRIAQELRELGHDVDELATAGSAIEAVHDTCPDLMVCEFALPDLSGIELLNDVRSSEKLRHLRVLMTSAAPGSGDVVAALESGADDFVAKPVDLQELTARIGACLNRPANNADAGRVNAGGIAIDKIGHRVTVDDTFVTLAPREYRLLLFLMTHQDRVFSRKQLLVYVWDRDVSVGPRTVDVHIRRLRSVLEPFDYAGYLQTVRGAGYRFSLHT